MTWLHFKRRAFDRLVAVLLFAAVIVSLIPLFLIFTHILQKGIGALNFDFFTHLPAPVGETGGGFGNAIVGTILLVSIALIVGVPIGVFAGVYLAQFGGREKLASAIRFAAETLAGTPSIVIGIFVYTLMVRPMRHFSLLAGGVSLAIIMLPVILRTTEIMLNMVPKTLQEAGLALGIPSWKVFFTIQLKTAQSGIVTGILLALSRAAGETAPLLFTALGNHYWSTDLLQPIAALPLQIFTYAVSPFDDWHRQAWAGALVLITMVLILNAIARLWSKNPLQGSR